MSATPKTGDLLTEAPLSQDWSQLTEEQRRKLKEQANVQLEPETTSSNQLLEG